MSVRSSANFGVYDLLTRIIPGGFLVLTIWLIHLFSANPENLVFPTLFTNTSGLILAGTLFFVVGEIVNFLRSLVHPVPYPFMRLLYQETGGKSKLPPHNQFILSTHNRLKELVPSIVISKSPRSVRRFVSPRVSYGVRTQFRYGFWTEFKDHFEVDDNLQQVTDIWGLFASFMEPYLTDDMRRQRTILHFLGNFVLSVCLCIYSVTSAYFIESGQMIVLAVLIIFISFLILYLVIPLFSLAESKYVNRLLISYYLSRTLDKY